jgi:hypothetical protein
MKNLKRLSAAVVLTLVIALSAFAGETQTPPCAPGQTETMPCSSAQMTTDNSPTPGETNTPPASNAVDVYSVAESTMNVLLSMLASF